MPSTRQRRVALRRALASRGAWPGNGPDVSSIRADLAVLAAIRAAVDRLPGSESSRNLAAVMAYRAWILDQPQASIAAELGIGPRTVTSPLHRLRTVLGRRDLLC